MFGSLGMPELIIILVAALFILGLRQLPRLGRSLGVGMKGLRGAENARATVTRASDVYGASPDWRYASGFRTGAVAELFGLGTRGLRWPQVLVIVVGTSLSNGVSSFVTGSLPGTVSLFLLIVSPATFVFAAITAARSFQSGPIVALFTGAMYSLLYTALRFGAHRYSDRGIDYWIQSAGHAFIWPALTMLALEFAVSGRSRWIRMAFALFVALLVEDYVLVGMYSGHWSPGPFVEVEAGGPVVTMIGSALIWTLAFWIGQTKFGNINGSTSFEG